MRNHGATAAAPLRWALDVANVEAYLRDRRPSLHLDQKTREPDERVIRGTLPVTHDGQELDQFQVEIDLSPVVRGNLPVVREVGGRIPWTAGRHVFSNGSCCVCLPEDYFARHPGPFDVVDFLEGPVSSYFIGQALFERGGQWPHGEWAHNSNGIDEWFAVFIRDTSIEQFRSYLLLLMNENVSGDEPCPCGSGKKLCECHHALTLRLRSIGHLSDPDALLGMGVRNLRRWMKRWALKSPPSRPA